jgi:hypothetical protein
MRSVLWSSGTGADVMKRIAAPMIGGLVTSFVLELLVYPAVFAAWKARERALRDGLPAATATGEGFTDRSQVGPGRPESSARDGGSGPPGSGIAS